MQCVKCKQTIDDDSIYCKFCGKKQVRESNKGKKQRGNGTGSVFKLPSGNYRAVVTMGYVDGCRIQRTKSGFKTKKEALEYLPILRADTEASKRIKFNQLYEMWKATHYLTIGQSKQQSYNTAYKRCEPLYFMYVDSIKLDDMQKIVDNCPYFLLYKKTDNKIHLT